jgi:hypothetical protein
MPLHPNQHEYDAGKSVETALHQLVVRVEKALDQETAQNVFLGTGPLITHLATPCVLFFLNAGLTTLSYDEFSKRVAVSRGYPQEGVLSPLLWCLVVDLIARLNGVGIYTQGHADDIFFWWEIPEIRYRDSYNGPFILYRCGATRSGCRLIPANLGLLYS